MKERGFTRERVTLIAAIGINQMWCLEFMYDMLYDNRKFGLLNLIDKANQETQQVECGS